MKRIQYLLLALTAMTLSASCDKVQEGALFNGVSQCSFAAYVVNAEVSEEDGNVIQIPVYRGTLDAPSVQELEFRYDTTGTGSTPDSTWVEEDPSGVFSLSTKRLVFRDNSYTAYAVISFSSLEDLSFSAKYRMCIKMKNRDDKHEYKITKTILTVGRKLTFETVGECSFMDYGIFDNAYKVTLQKAKEANVYRVLNPYNEGLVAEEYAEMGLMSNPPEYVQFMVGDSGLITYDPFYTGMLVPAPNGKLYKAYSLHPADYKVEWGKDFSRFIPDNKQISATEFQLNRVLCLPDLSYGYLDDGIFKINIKLL